MVHRAWALALAALAVRPATPAEAGPREAPRPAECRLQRANALSLDRRFEQETELKLLRHPEVGGDIPFHIYKGDELVSSWIRKTNQGR